MELILNGGVLQGEVRAIPSKSVAHRALICAALSDGRTTLELPEGGEDLKATVRCLRAMGAEVGRSGESIEVRPMAGTVEKAVLDCGESGSTLRFLLPVAAAQLKEAVFTGRGRLPERPISGLSEALRQNGAHIAGERLPLAVSGALHAGDFTIEGNVSSQYVSGLLMALPLLDGDSRILLKSPLCSAPYVRLTSAILTRFGIEFQESGEGYLVHGSQRYRSPGALAIEGDWSAAAFFLSAGALGGEVGVKGLRLDSTQGDRAIVELLRSFGATLRMVSDTVYAAKAPMRGCTVDVSDIPDLLPVLAVIAACADGTSEFVHAEHLRGKESDRLASTAALINALGGRARAYPDRLEVTGGRLCGGTVESFGDHRIVMAAAVAASVCGERTVIRGAQAAAKSYPGFFSDFAALGGNIIS